MHAYFHEEIRDEKCIVLSINVNAILVIIQSTVIYYGGLIHSAQK